MNIGQLIGNIFLGIFVVCDIVLFIFVKKLTLSVEIW